MLKTDREDVDFLLVSIVLLKNTQVDRDRQKQKEIKRNLKMGNSTTTIPKQVKDQDETIEVTVIDALGAEDVLEDDSLKKNCPMSTSKIQNIVNSLLQPRLLFILTIFLICMAGASLIAANGETTDIMVIYIIS